MSFSASAVVEPLDYDFRPYVEAHGTISEPSLQALETWREWKQRQLRGLLARSVRDSGTELTAEQQADVDFDPSEHEAASVHAALCSNAPTAEQILALPARPLREFYGWLEREMLNPTKAGTPAS